MGVIGNLAGAGLAVILGTARGLSGWTGAIVMAVAGFALVSSGAHAQTRIDEVVLQATAPVEEAPVVPAVWADQQAQEGDPEQPGSAIYNPFSASAIAQQGRPSVASKASSAPESGLTMTLTASTAGAVALVWLLQRIRCGCF